MIRKAQFFGALLGLLGLSACASKPPLATPITATTQGRVSFEKVRAYPTKDGVLIRGSVRRSFVHPHSLRGHLHVTASLTDAPPVSVDASWWRRQLNHRHRATYFSALFKNIAPDRIQSISVAYRALAEERE